MEKILKEIFVAVTPTPQEVSNNKVKGRRRIQKCGNDEESDGSNPKVYHEKKLGGKII